MAQERAIQMNSTWSKAIGGLLACAAPLVMAQKLPEQPVARACLPLLVLSGVQAGVEPARLTMDTCDFDFDFAVDAGVPGGNASLRLKPRGLARDALAEALGPTGRYFSSMLAASLRIDPAASDLHGSGGVGFPAGLLLASESARLVPEGHWRWNRGERALRWVPRTAPWPAPEVQACASWAGRRVVFWAGALERQPGDLLAPAPWTPGHAPGFQSRVPQHCATGWRLSAGAPAKIDRDTGVVVLDADALKAGSPQAFSVFADVAGQRIEGKVLAFDRAQQPLVGSWRQLQQSGCASQLKGMTHLELSADGRFQWREVPFEFRYDGWGRYLQAAPGAPVTFDVEGGNATEGLKQVRASLEFPEPRRMVLRGVTLGGAQAGERAESACRMEYAR